MLVADANAYEKLSMACGCFDAIAKLLSRKSQRSLSQEDQGPPGIKNIKLFSYLELRSATNNFHPSNKIGRGGFGTVYKGTHRSGVVLAAKVLSAESRQGLHEFLTEIEVISNVKHVNLIELIGCCVEGGHRILVYEYAENGSIDQALLGSKSDKSKMDWQRRSTIIIGTARGLSILHEEQDPPIVHRDIKASNILLGRNFVPKIGDFGLAKLFPDNVTHLSTRVAGTTGYLAPEYAKHGQLTKKADVYGFGVLILEIVSGRSNSRGAVSEPLKLLLEWSWQLYEEQKLLEMVDPDLKDCPEEEVLRFMKVALFCTQAAAARRPAMDLVVEMLSRPIRLNEKELTRPGILQDSNSRTAKDSSSQTSNPVFDTISKIGPR